MGLRELIRQRLASIDVASPCLDRSRVEEALSEHFRCVGLDPVALSWEPRPSLAGNQSWGLERNRSYEQRAPLSRVFDPDTRDFDPMRRRALNDLQAFWADLGIRRFTHTTRRGGFGRVLAASSHLVSRVAFVAPPLSDDLRRRRALLSLADAAAAGLFAFWVRAGRAILVPRPRLLVEEGRPHAWDGRAALTWADGEQIYFWRGIDVGARVGRDPEGIRLKDIHSRRNAEVRRLLIERYGWDRYLRDSRAQRLAGDGYGTLWRVRSRDSEGFAVLLEVENSTPEPDGSHKRYFLRVPPEVRTAHEAVAWTFGFDAEGDYAPASES